MKALGKSDLGTFLQALDNTRRVVALLEDGAELVFGDLDLGRLAFDCTGRPRFSPKEFLFPESEVLLSFDLSKPAETVKIAEHVTDRPTAIWGVRPCDLAGLQALDAVFLSDPVDVYYSERRRNTLFFGLNCREACKSCFCASTNTGPFATEGFDLLFTDLGDHFFVEVGSEAGGDVIQEQAALFSPAGEGDREAARALEREARATFVTELAVSQVLDRLPDHFEDPIWEELARKCTLCGTCCIVCPACHCFNIEDIVRTRKLVQRVRYWDCCQLGGFTRMAQENSRDTQGQRFRQKIYDKFRYFPAAHGGLLGCTGCGRCLELCQGSISIVDVLRRVTGEWE